MHGQPPSDSKLVKTSLERISKAYGKPESYTADCGFDRWFSLIELSSPLPVLSL